VEPDELWSDHRGAKPNFTSFVEKAILESRAAPVQILFDEVDIIFDFPGSRQNLFSMLRAWHNRRATDPKGRWKNLRLVIAHATDPALWIPDPSQSPFNVGLPITLDDFDFGRVQELNRLHGDPLNSETEIQQLMDLVGGHPYLLRLALYTLIQGHKSLTELVVTADHESGPFSSHLRHYLSLISREELGISISEILGQGICSNEMHFQRLWAAGLICAETPQRVEMRCRLYREFFKNRL
jgi:hypothetical protein